MTARTIMETAALPDALVPEIAQAIKKKGDDTSGVIPPRFLQRGLGRAASAPA